ncbi:MAG: sulfite oxidase-like oxidoreductase [Alphaproteobacteria bacterium]|nr:sulfite oxidase-like oxidoreductase [Alphaproteobacteria bacterium]
MTDSIPFFGGQAKKDPLDRDPFSGRLKEKLIGAKESWARDGRLLTGDAPSTGRRRLPPGQRLVTDWPELDLGVQPNLLPKDWSLEVSGLIDRPFKWTYTQLKKQPQAEVVSDIHCVTAWSRYDNRWQGVSARHLMSVAKPRPEARFLILKSYDGYSTGLPLAHFGDEDVLLATHWEGRPLTRGHGGPVRLVVPKLYFWKSAKWIRSIRFTDRDVKGFWEARGYHDLGDPWKEQRYG